MEDFLYVFVTLLSVMFFMIGFAMILGVIM